MSRKSAKKTKKKKTPKGPKKSADKSASAVGVAVQKPRADVYTMMLIISLIAVIIGIVMLNVALSQYGPWPQWKTTSLSVPMLTQPSLASPMLASLWL